MRTCLEIIAGVVTGLFIVTLLLTLLLFNLLTIATNRATVKDALPADAELRTVILRAVAEQLTTVMAETLPPEVIDAPTIENGIHLLAPAGWVEEQVTAGVDDLFDWLDGRQQTEVPEITIDITPLLLALQGEPGRQLVTELAHRLPPCSLEDIIPIDPESGRLRIPSCIPPFVTANDVAQVLHLSLSAALDLRSAVGGEPLVIRFSLLPPEQAEVADAVAGWQRLQRLYQIAQGWAWLLWVPPLLLFLLIPPLAARSLVAWGYWWGWPLIMTGGLLLVLVVVLRIVNGFVEIPLPLPAAGPADNAILLDAFGRVFEQTINNLRQMWLTRLSWQGAGLMIGGAFLVLVSFVLGLLQRPAGRRAI